MLQNKPPATQTQPKTTWGPLFELVCMVGEAGMVEGVLVVDKSPPLA